jgi:hypothetical protein
MEWGEAGGMVTKFIEGEVMTRCILARALGVVI